MIKLNKVSRKELKNQIKIYHSFKLLKTFIKMTLNNKTNKFKMQSSGGSILKLMIKAVS